RPEGPLGVAVAAQGRVTAPADRERLQLTVVARGGRHRVVVEGADAPGRLDGEGVVPEGLAAPHAVAPDEAAVVAGVGVGAGRETEVPVGAVAGATWDGGEDAAGGVALAPADGGPGAAGGVNGAPTHCGVAPAGGVAPAPADGPKVGAHPVGEAGIT